MTHSKIRGAGLVLLMVLAAGCSSIGYKAWELLGYAKRDLLISNVKKARDAQSEAKEQFKDALEQFSSVVNFSGGDLEATYNKMVDAYESSESEANAVSKRIAKVEQVSNDLFAEWEKELQEYTNQDLKRSSEKKLRDTKARCNQLISKMRAAEGKMKPVLSAFKDQVLTLKHSLNAKAVASLKNELVSVENDVAALIKDMEASMADADAFISDLSAEE